MASLFRREYKNKLSEAGITEACKIVRDPNLWETALPECVDKANSPRADIRLAALKSMNEILSGKYIGPDLGELVQDIFGSLVGPITEPASQQEHDEALTVICNLALNSYRDMEEEAFTFLDEIMPTLPGTLTEQNYRFFAVAFVAGFTISSNEKCEAVLSRFLELIINKKKRGVTFEGETVAAIINGCSLLLSILPSTVCVGKLGATIAQAIDVAFSSQKLEVLLAALEALPIIYECIAECEHADLEEDYEADAGHFAAKYKNKILTLADRVEKKQDQKIIRTKVDDIIGYFNGDEITETVTLNEQDIELDGPRKVFISGAIRRVTGHHYALMMSQNIGIHNALGFELKATHHVLQQKKKVKKQTERERLQSTKERQMRLANERKKKDRKFEPEDY